jgi:3-phenylpropionate/cinnamic acid dioxygenase small subunit
MGKILDFLFGKRAPIFDANGEVKHNLPKEKWDAWNNRYHQGAEYNWRNHVGTKSAGQDPKRRNSHS